MSSENSGQEIDLRIGQLAIRNEFLNLSELKHCINVLAKLQKKGHVIEDFGEVLIKERYITPENHEYLLMISRSEPVSDPVTLGDIEQEYRKQVAQIKKGSKFGPFKIIGELGRGGMGVVLRAHDEDRDTPVALKVLIGGDKATVRDIERFKKEATVMMPLIHPGIVRIYDVGRIKGLDFISMEFVDGKSLKELVKEDPNRDPVECLRIIRSAAEAVGFIHGSGIIHRDIKPENIMVRDSDGSAVLMDFGLAGWDKIEVLAGRGSIGTPMYQPPEQAEVGGPFGGITPASDVYGLGATLYYLATGHHPFTGRSVKEVREKIKHAMPTKPSSRRADLPNLVEAIIMRSMRKKQGERFATPKDMIDAIDKVLKNLGAEPVAEKSDSRRASAHSMRPGRRTGINAAVGGKSGSSGRSKKRTGSKRGPKVASPGTQKLRRPASPAGRRTGEHKVVYPPMAWYEQPSVMIMGTFILLILLAGLGAVLIK